MARNRALKAKFEKAKRQRLGIFGTVAPQWSPGECIGDYRPIEAHKAPYNQGKAIVPEYDPAMVRRFDNDARPVDYLRRKGSVSTPQLRGRMVHTHMVAPVKQPCVLTPDVYHYVANEPGRLIPRAR